MLLSYADCIVKLKYAVVREFLFVDLKTCNTLSSKAAPPNPAIGVGTRTHITLLTLSSSLRVKGSTRRCYGWGTKAYKLASPLLN